MMSVEPASQSDTFIILTPVFNDWDSFGLLVKKLDTVFGQSNASVEVLVVDDASTMPFAPDHFSGQSFKFLQKIRILELTRNIGHQRAIAIGLAYVEANLPCRAVIVMDADGEDDPSDVPRLIAKCNEVGYTKMVFARRARRREDRTFKIFYMFYKGLYKLLTGISMRVGNFSIIPYEVLHRLVRITEIWNHYAGGVMKARIPTTELLADRGKRLAGQSSMNFVSLVVHGLSAISIYGDIIGVRLLLSTLLLMLLSILGIGVTAGIRFMTTLAIPGWATYLSGILLLIALQALVLSLFFILVALGSRNYASFVPMRDYSPFIYRIRTVYPRS